MSWIKVSQCLRSHIKVLRVSAMLTLDRATVIGLVVSLWLWALDNAPDGIIPVEDFDLLAREYRGGVR